MEYRRVPDAGRVVGGLKVAVGCGGVAYFPASEHVRMCATPAGRSGGGLHQHITGGAGVVDSSVFTTQVTAVGNHAGELNVNWLEDVPF